MDGKWQPRDISDAEVERLIRERTSPAVKTALKNLIEAPMPTGSGRRKAGRRVARRAGAATG